MAATKNFVCATFKGTSGWLPTHDLCLHAKPRLSRTGELTYEDNDHLPCDDARTIPSDESFFGGTFASDSAELKTEYSSPSRVRFRTALADEGCHETLSGLADIKGDVATDSAGTTLTFRDDGVDLAAGQASPCPGLSKEFFVDPGGSQLAASSKGSSACNVENANLEKRPLVSLYYTLKRALAKDARDEIASLIGYPLAVNAGRNRYKVRRPEDFIARYDAIVNQCLKASLLRSRIGDVFCQDQGAAIGNGLVWVNGDPKAPTIGTINVPVCGKKPTR